MHPDVSKLDTAISLAEYSRCAKSVQVSGVH